eukprot:6177878-Pleurochrysis_carterae.AAC.2
MPRIIYWRWTSFAATVNSCFTLGRWGGYLPNYRRPRPGSGTHPLICTSLYSAFNLITMGRRDG